MVVLLPWYTILSCNYGEFAPRYTMLSCNYGDSEPQITMLTMNGHAVVTKPSGLKSANGLCSNSGAIYGQQG
jgi:hypothetical protein